MVSEQNIQALSDQIVQLFHAEKVILFGSHAYGHPRQDSDVDLLVLLPFNGNTFRKSLEILNLIEPKFSVDLIVRNPKDAQRRHQQGDPLMREVFDRGKVLYERCH